MKINTPAVQITFAILSERPCSLGNILCTRDALHCIILNGFVINCIVCMAMLGVAWYSMVLRGIAWYCMVLHGIA